MEQASIDLQIRAGELEPLNEDEMFQRLSRKAHELNAEFVSHNKNALLDAISDSISAFVLIIIAVTANEGVQNLLSTTGRFFKGLSDTAKVSRITRILSCSWQYRR